MRSVIELPEVIKLVEKSRDEKWPRRKLITELELFETFSENEIDDILEWYKGWYT